MSERYSVALEVTGMCTRHPTGVAVYVRGFLNELLRRPDEVDVGLYYKHKLTKRYSPFFKDLPKPKRYVLKSVPPNTGRPITHSLNKCFLYNRDAINIATIHDVTYFVQGNHVDTTIGPWFKSKVHRSNRKIVGLADHIITGSSSAKADIAEIYGFDPERISVVYPGFQPISQRHSEDDGTATLAKFGQKPGGYFLYAGRVEQVKNVVSMIEAFAASGLSKDLDFVVAGPPQPDTPSIQQRVKELGLSGSVKFPGYVSADELAALYRHAKGFVFPTYYEGFGMPILEAMSCGVPVLIGSNGAAPEVAAGHAIVADPFSIEEIKKGMLKLAGHEFDSEALKRHAATFTWNRFVDEVFELYDRLLDRKG